MKQPRPDRPVLAALQVAWEARQQRLERDAQRAALSRRVTALKSNSKATRVLSNIAGRRHIVLNDP